MSFFWNLLTIFYLQDADLDEDFDSSAHDAKMSKLFGDEYYEIDEDDPNFKG